MPARRIYFAELLEELPDDQLDVDFQALYE